MVDIFKPTLSLWFAGNLLCIYSKIKYIFKIFSLCLKGLLETHGKMKCEITEAYNEKVE